MTDDKEKQQQQPEDSTEEIKTQETSDTDETSEIPQTTDELGTPDGTKSPTLEQPETAEKETKKEPKEEQPKAKKGLLGRLASLRLAIVIFVYLMVICIIATLLPQNQDPTFYTENYGALGNMIVGISLDSIYTSFWMIIGGAALGINLLACTWRRLKWSLNKRAQGEVFKFDITGEEETFDGTMEQAQETFKKRFPGYALKHKENEIGEVAWTGTRGRAAFWGSPILHLGLCVVLVGVLLSMILGNSAFKMIGVGEEEEIDVGPKTYTLRIDDFDIDYYEDETTPMQYSSTMTGIYNDEETELTTEVNAPAKFHGTQILQSSYGWVLQMSASDGETSREFTMSDSDEYWLNEDQHLTLRVRFYPDYALDEEGNIINASNDPNNPTLLCMVLHNGQPLAAESFSPGVEKELLEGLSLEFLGFNYATGLQIKYDPGVSVIFIGFILIAFGMTLRFIIPGKILRAVFTETKEGVEIKWQQTSII